MMNDKIKFEKVSRFKDVDFKMPERKTMYSAGYDMVVAENVVIPPYNELMTKFDYEVFNKRYNHGDGRPLSLDEVATITKASGAKPTLVSTGVKAYMPFDMYLELSLRSSCPLKYWLIMTNSQGIIDADYADCEANEGEIFFQLINLSTVPIILKKGDVIGQGIFHHYYRTDGDMAYTKRDGGLGSTSV